MVTIEDIAREAGVSSTTVSNVIHGRTGRVSDATVKRINEIIRRRGYVPNLSARALKGRSSRLVALINHLDGQDRVRFWSDPFYNTLTGAVEEALRAQGYFLMVRAISDREELLEFLRNWNVEGVFLPGLFESDPFYRTLYGLDLPVVLTDSYLPDYGRMCNVGLQDREGAKMATEYLIACGHRELAFAGPPLRPGGVLEQRLLGFRQALEDHGLPFRPDRVFACEFDTDAMLRLGARLAGMPEVTGVFATADLLAAGLTAGAVQAGRPVPETLSVVGFDDIAWCRMTRPRLTTVRQDAEQKGRLAAELMLRLLAGEEVSQRRITLPVSLVVRDSVRSR